MSSESTEAAPVKKKNLCMSLESTRAATKNRRRIDVLGKYWSSPCQEEESISSESTEAAPAKKKYLSVKYSDLNFSMKAAIYHQYLLKYHIYWTELKVQKVISWLEGSFLL